MEQKNKLTSAIDQNFPVLTKGGSLSFPDFTGPRASRPPSKNLNHSASDIGILRPAG